MSEEEGSAGVFQRYLDILAERRLRPFHREPWVNPRTGRRDPRVLGERPRMQWRVSSDEWARLETWFRNEYEGRPMVGQTMLFGWPIESDLRLPPQSVVFEGRE